MPYYAPLLSFYKKCLQCSSGDIQCPTQLKTKVYMITYYVSFAVLDMRDTNMKIPYVLQGGFHN